MPGNLSGADFLQTSCLKKNQLNMPGKTHPQGGPPGQSRGRPARHDDGSESGTGDISFEVYHSEAITFHKNADYRKAINSYTRVG